MNVEPPAAVALALTNDTAVAIEAGGTTNGTAGTNPTGSVLGNDQGASPTVTAIQLVSDTTATAVTAGTNSATGTSITGQYGTLRIGADGSYSYAVDNANATVQGLRTASNTLTEVFTYTANDGTGPKTANLVVTVKGANDAPTLVVPEPDKTGLLVGTAISSFSIAGNFADVDSTANGETATYSASPLPAGITFNAATGTFSGTPTTAGTTTVTVTRTDAGGLTVTDTIDFVIGDVITKTVAFSSMTKDSGTLVGDNDNWLTADASAGRLVSGTISAALGTNEVVEVYANGTKIGNARVVGTAWDITDLNGYNANWTYTAKVANPTTSSSGATATQVVTTDFTVDAPVITGVFDSAVAGAATVAHNGSTTSPLASVSGTASANALVYLYDNTSTNLVGTAVADASGNWTVSGFGVLPTANTFAAKQVDVHGNESVLSNLWTVTTTSSGGFNGNFDSGSETGFATDLTLLTAATSFNYVQQRFGFAVLEKPLAYGPSGYPQSELATMTQSAATTWNGTDTWTQKIYAPDTSVSFVETEKGYNTFLSLAKGKIYYGSFDNFGGVGELGTLWGSQVDVVKGQTYQFSFDYWNTAIGQYNPTNNVFIRALIDGQQVMATQNRSTGSVTINYTATSTGQIDLTLGAMGWGSSGDFALDNISFAQVAPSNGSLVAGTNPGFSDSTNGTSSTPVSYSGGAVNAMGGSDVIAVAAGVNLQTALATGGSYINGGSGADTLVLNAGTTLNLPALSSTQTVQPIQQVEIFKLQGTSTLTLSANDVLSLGGSNATTMIGYSFAGSTGKVQMVVEATSTDAVVLTPLSLDSVTTNGVVGNTGLAGTWSAAGTATIGGNTYSVYNHSTTDAQVLVSGASVNPAGTTAASQAVVITKVENSGAAASYVEEFNSGTTTVSANILNPASAPTFSSTTAINTAGTKINTGAWEVSVKDIWYSWQANQSFAPVNVLYLRSGATTPNNAIATATNTMLGTDGKLQLGLDADEAPNGANDARLYTFTSQAGPFTSMSFKSFGLSNMVENGQTPPTWSYPQVSFRDEEGNVVYRTDFKTLSSNTKLDIFDVTLPAGVTASSFEFRTINADRWFIDDLSMTAASNEIVPHLGTTADTTHKISGTYANTLNPGEVIKIYDATGTVLLGTAVVDPDTKTWTFESPTPAAVGTHPYVAKIESSASAVVATSNTYTVNILGAGQLDIASISADSGTAGDFITNDNTLVYSGTLPQPLATGEKVRVQIFAADGTTLVRETTVTPASGSTTWAWDNTAAAALADGNYVIKATIVATDGVTAVASYGARGTDTQPMVIDSAPPAQTVTFTSMTKDSGIAGANADWTTADASAGRLISGAVSAPLGANDVLKIYANGVEIGNATVSGTQWTITDPAAYSANWTYTAKVVDVAGGAGPEAIRVVTLDTASSAAVISSVMESGASTAITDGSGTMTSAKVITTVSGTGTAGDVVYVYDSSSTNLIGSATVAAGGAWTITGLSLPAGAHTFAAVQRDALGNISPNSNLFKLAAGQVNTAGNMLAAVRLEEEGGWAYSQSNMTNTALNFYPGKGVNSGPGYETFRVFFKEGGMSSVSITFSQLPDLQSSADKVQIRFFDANGDLLGMMQNGFFASLLTINYTQPQLSTFNSGTFLNGQLAARMEISAGVSTAYTISNLGLTPGDTNTLTANTPLGVVGTSGVDAMTYNGGAMSGLGGDDVITAQVSTVQAQLAAGGIINGGSGVDTLKLQPGTTLDLTAITGNQTVKNIQEVEIFQMQGQSTLTMSANDVMSLGATDLAGYSFSSSTTASAGKVQFVVLGTGTDKLKLSNLSGDALGSNTGTLPGEWLDKGTVTIGGVAYQVFDHSTSKAQVLVGGATQTAVSSNGVAISSMTLDTGTAGDFITSNGAAGRTVTGTIATALSSGDRVEVYADGVLIGNATVSGTNWTLTDTTAHTANWTYTAKLVTASGTASATTNVVYDGVEAAPAITGVTDSKGNAVASGALTSGNFLSQTAASDTATSPDFAFYIDHVGPNGLTSDSNLTTGPKTVNPIYGINLAYGQEGGMFDAQNPTGPGSKIEMASKNLMTLTKGQAYTFSFDAHAGAQNIDPTLPILSYATQIKWVLLDANGVQQADVTPWYSGPGRIERNASAYGEAIRLNSRTDSQAYGDAFVNYQTNFLSDLPTGQYRLALAYEGGGTNVMIDRTYFGVAKNPVNSVSGTGTPGSLIQLFDNGSTTVLGSTTVGADGTWTVTGLNLAAGTHSFTAKSTDAAGTVSAASVAYNATVTPVTLDLNGDGQIGYNQIKMDLNRDGILDTTAWVAAQDGLLVHDIYGDGSVRENSQFAFARHGGETDLQGLAAQFDSNNDGVLDAKDSQFGEFAVWQDTDQDGVADAGEVKTLADLGITALQLNSDGVQRTPETGVTEAGRTTAQLANGSTLVVADAAFNYTLTAASEVSLVASVIPAEGSVIPAPEPGSMTPMTLQVNGAGTTIDLASFVAQNANADITQVDLSGTGDNTLRLSLTDVLQQANANGQALQIDGNAGDAVELFTQGTAPVQTSTSINGHDYAAYDLDRNGSMDLLVDQAVRVSLS
jgi:VCBS repeat-containing protein